LLELLVVIAIIAVLMGLLLPAVQRAREAAARASCGNNLKQLGLAMHTYHNDYGRLPPNRLDVGYATWAVLILPYVEQGSLYNRWDLTKDYYRQSNVARLSPVKIYFCPSRRSSTTDPTASTYGDVPSWAQGDPANVPGALGDYAVCIDRTGHDATGKT
jgi:type II secretory pathway pseudopilin PulG